MTAVNRTEILGSQDLTSCQELLLVICIALVLVFFAFVQF